MIHLFAHPELACCWVLLEVVAQSLKPVKHKLCANECKISQQCWQLLVNNVASVCTQCLSYIWQLRLAAYNWKFEAK